MRLFNIACLAICSTFFLAACGDSGTSAQSETHNGQTYMTDDRDGQTYRVVTIGSQTWMAENLNFETDSSFCYNNEETNCSKYGRLYKWAAAVGKSESECGYRKRCSLPSGIIQGVCPSGWHLPSRAEWETLFDAVGGQSTAGKVLKSTSGWNNGFYDTEGTDAFGFSALPAGGRGDNGGYYSEGDIAYFWSSTEYNSDIAYSMGLYDDAVAANLHYSSKYNGFSVRCIKDGMSREKAKSSSSVVPVSSSSVVKSSSSFYQFNPNIEYGELTDTRDGQTYKTVIIGTQTWMAQNLNFKTDSSFCYNDEESNCTKYGRLYRWAAAIGKSEGECGFGYTCSLPLGNIQGVCPSGWHLPDSTEWKTLFAAVGGQWEGEGGVLMSTSGWNDYVDESARATDDFGFSALPAGSRGGSDGIYENDGVFTAFWSSSIVFEGSVEDGSFVEAPHFARCSALQPGAMNLPQCMKSIGMPVRCLKD